MRGRPFRTAGRWAMHAATFVALLASSTLVAIPSAGAASGASTPTSALAWTRCRSGFQCATLPVPVDPAAPDGEQVSLALIRSPARRPTRRLGVLVVNYGGPGEAGTDALPASIDQLPAIVRDRFDIVSFDPRGTGKSRPVDCIDDRAADLLVTDDPTPDDPSELERFYTGANSSVDVTAGCIARNGDWLARLGTRNVAADLDRIRVALGERQISFLGYSYGTVLGAVYAQTFPHQVRAMVLDAAVNLSATPEEEQQANAAGFERALDEFLAWCGRRPSCPFFSSGDPATALERLRDRFEAGTTLPVRDGRHAGPGTFYLGLVTALYDRAHGWPALASALERAGGGDGSPLQLLADAYTGRDASGHYSNIQEVIGPILCDDRPHDFVSFAQYRATYDAFVHDYPVLGRLVAASPIGCDPRLPAPAADAVLGDVRADAVAPVLVVGNTGDPATPYAGARDLQRRIRGSRLLTYVSTEHGAYGRGVACIDASVDTYLVHRRLPARGTRCNG